MSTRPFPSSLVAFGLSALLALGALSGCDAARVDQGADVPLAAHLEALSSADTPDKAERAFRGVFNKVGIRTAWQGNVAIDAHPYGLYSVTDDELTALAERQAAFVSGQRAQAPTYASTHAAVLDADAKAFEIVRALNTSATQAITRGAITIGAENALDILQAQARASLASPEAQTSAIVLLAATTSLDAIPTLSTAAELSPAQEFLYSVWLHRNGPLMYDALRPNAGAPRVARACVGADCDGDQTSCDPCCDGTGKFTDVTFQYTGDVAATVRIDVTGGPNGTYLAFGPQLVQPGEILYVTGASRLSNGGFSGTLGNNLEVFVDGTEIDYAPYGDPDDPDADTRSIHTSCSELVLPGDVYGDFLIVAVATQNGGLCSSLSTCVGACQTQLNACLVAANGDAAAEQACQDEFRACDLNCHDQGGVSP